MTELSLRAATKDDSDLLLAWVNDSHTRQMSFSKKPVARADHERWLENKLRDPNCLLYIVIDAAGKPLGQVRFDIGPDREAVISASIDPEFRGRGIGAASLRLATLEACRTAELTAVRANVLPENAASLRAFERAGYGPPRSTEHLGMPALCLTFRA